MNANFTFIAPSYRFHMFNMFKKTTSKSEETARKGASLFQRKYRMNRPVRLKKHWMNGDPFATAFFNSLSISFPHAEISMINSVKLWREHLSPCIQKDIETFIAQELNHSREHVAFNRGLLDAGYEIATVEKDILKLVEDLKHRDDVFQLRATVCMEHLTAILSAEILTNSVHMEGAEPELKKMWLWHATEEIEHKAVAYNAWNEVTKDWSGLRRWCSRSFFYSIISYRFFRNRTIAQIHLLKQDGYSSWQAFWGMMKYGFTKQGLAKVLIKPWFQFFKPNFHPWDIDDRHLIAVGESKFMMDKEIEQPLHQIVDRKSEGADTPDTSLSKVA